MQQCLPFFWGFHSIESSGPALIKRLVHSLLPFLDDADRRLRCVAADSLSLLVDEDGTLQKELDFFDRLLERLARGNFVQATPEEQEMLESVRAAAKKWLDEHK